MCLGFSAGLGAGCAASSGPEGHSPTSEHPSRVEGQTGRHRGVRLGFGALDVALHLDDGDSSAGASGSVTRRSSRWSSVAFALAFTTLKPNSVTVAMTESRDCHAQYALELAPLAGRGYRYWSRRKLSRRSWVRCWASGPMLPDTHTVVATVDDVNRIRTKTTKVTTAGFARSPSRRCRGRQVSGTTEPEFGIRVATRPAGA